MLTLTHKNTHTLGRNTDTQTHTTHTHTLGRLANISSYCAMGELQGTVLIKAMCQYCKLRFKFTFVERGTKSLNGFMSNRS